MAESADAPDSGSGGSNTVCVQVTLSAPKKPSQLRQLRGFLLFYHIKSNAQKVSSTTIINHKHYNTKYSFCDIRYLIHSANNYILLCFYSS